MSVTAGRSPPPVVIDSADLATTTAPAEDPERAPARAAAALVMIVGRGVTGNGPILSHELVLSLAATPLVVEFAGETSQWRLRQLRPSLPAVWLGRRPSLWAAAVGWVVADEGSAAGG